MKPDTTAPEEEFDNSDDAASLKSLKIHDSDQSHQNVEKDDLLGEVMKEVQTLLNSKGIFLKENKDTDKNNVFSSLNSNLNIDETKDQNGKDFKDNEKLVKLIVEKVKSALNQDKQITSATFDDKLTKNEEDAKDELNKLKKVFSSFGLPMNVDESKIEVNWRFKDNTSAETSDQQNLQYTQMQAMQQTQYHQLQPFQPYQQQSYNYQPNVNDAVTNVYKNNNLYFLSPNYNNSFSSNLLNYSPQQANNEKQQNINPLYLNNNNATHSTTQTQHSNPLLDSTMSTTSSISNEKLIIKTSVDSYNNTLGNNYFNNLLTTVVMSNESSMLNTSATFTTSTATFNTTSTSVNFSQQFSVPFTNSNMSQMDQQNYQKSATVEMQQKQQNMDYNFDPAKSNVNDTLNNSQKNNNTDECFTSQLNESYQKLPNGTDFGQQSAMQQDFQLKGNQAPSNIILPNGQVITINNNLNKSLVGNNVMTSNQAYNSFQNNVSPFVQPSYITQLKGDPTSSVFSQQQITSHFSQQATPMNSFVQNGPYQINNSNMQLMNNPLLINSATPNNFMNNTNMNQTVTVNTPQGAMVMHTVPSKPNELPQALILPDGQIVPVVTQPNLLFPSQQCIPIAGPYLVPNNSSKSSKSLLSNSSLQQILPANTTTMSVNSFQKPVLSSETKSKKKINSSANKKTNANKTSLPISMTAVLTPEGNVILSFPQSSSTVTTFSEIKPKPLQRTLMPKPSGTQLPTQNLLITQPLNSSLQSNFALGAHPFTQNALFPNIVQMPNQFPIINQPQAFIQQPTLFNPPLQQNFDSSAQTFNVMNNNNNINFINSCSINSSIMPTSNLVTSTMNNSLLSPKTTITNTDILAQATQTIFTAEQTPLSLSLANQPPSLLTSSSFEKPSTTLLTTNSFYQPSVCSSQNLSSNFSLTSNNLVSTPASDMVSFYTPSLVSNSIDTIAYQANKPKRKRKKRQPKASNNLPSISKDAVPTTSNLSYNNNNNDLNPNDTFIFNAQVPEQDVSKTTSEGHHDPSNNIGTSQNDTSAYPEQSFTTYDNQKEQAEKEHQGVEEACMDNEEQAQDITDFSDLIRMHPMTPRPTYDWQAVNTPVQHCPKSPAMSTPVFNSHYKKSLKHELGRVADENKESDVYFGMKMNNGEDKSDDHCMDDKSAESKDSKLSDGEIGLFNKFNHESFQDSQSGNTEATKDSNNDTEYLPFFPNSNNMTNKDNVNTIDNNKNNVNSNNVNNSFQQDIKDDFYTSNTNNKTPFPSNINQFELPNSNNINFHNEEDKSLTVEKADKNCLNNVKSKRKNLKINEKEVVDENTNCAISSFETAQIKNQSYNENNKHPDSKKVKNKKFFNKDSRLDDNVKQEINITRDVSTEEFTDQTYIDERNENKIKKTIKRNSNENRMIRKNRGERRSSRNKNKTKSDPYAFNGDDNDDDDVAVCNRDTKETDMRTTKLSAISVNNFLDFNNTNTVIDFSKNYNGYNQNTTMDKFNTDFSKEGATNTNKEIVKKGRGRRKKTKLSDPLSPGQCQEYVISVEKLEAQNKDGDEDEDDDEGEEEANVSSLFTHEENEIPFEHQIMQVEGTQTAPVSKKRKKKERKKSSENRKKLKKNENDNLLEMDINQNGNTFETNSMEIKILKELNGVEADKTNEVNVSESTQTENKRSSHKHKKKRKHDMNGVVAFKSNEDKEQTHVVVSNGPPSYEGLANTESRLESSKYTDSDKCMDNVSKESNIKNPSNPSLTMKIRKDHQNYKVHPNKDHENHPKDSLNSSDVFNPLHKHQKANVESPPFAHSEHGTFPLTSSSYEGSFPPSSFYSHLSSHSNEIHDSKGKDVHVYNQCNNIQNNEKQETTYINTDGEAPQMHSISTDTSGIPGRPKKKRRKGDKKSKNNGNKTLSDVVVDKQGDDLSCMKVNSTLYENAFDSKIFSEPIQGENDKTNKFVILKQPKITKSEENELTDVSCKENVPNANNNIDIYNYSRKNVNLYETVSKTQLEYNENANKENSTKMKESMMNTQPISDSKNRDYFGYGDKTTNDNMKDTPKVKAQHSNLASLARGMNSKGGGVASKITSCKQHEHPKEVVYQTEGINYEKEERLDKNKNSSERHKDKEETKLSPNKNNDEAMTNKIYNCYNENNKDKMQAACYEDDERNKRNADMDNNRSDNKSLNEVSTYHYPDGDMSFTNNGAQHTNYSEFNDKRNFGFNSSFNELNNCTYSANKVTDAKSSKAENNGFNQDKTSALNNKLSTNSYGKNSKNNYNTNHDSNNSKNTKSNDTKNTDNISGINNNSNNNNINKSNNAKFKNECKQAISCESKKPNKDEDKSNSKTAYNSYNKQLEMKNHYENYQYYYNNPPYYNPQFNLDQYSTSRFNTGFSFDSNPLSFFRDFSSFSAASPFCREISHKSSPEQRLPNYSPQALSTHHSNDDRASSVSSSSSFKQQKKTPTISNYTPSPFLDNFNPFFNIPPFSPSKSNSADNFSSYFHYNFFPNKSSLNIKSPNSKNSVKPMQSTYSSDAYLENFTKAACSRDQDKTSFCNQNPAHQHSLSFSPFFSPSDFMNPFYYPPNQRTQHPSSSTPSSSSSSESAVKNFHSSYYQQQLNYHSNNNNRAPHDFNYFFNQQSPSFPLNPPHFPMHNI